MHLESMEKIDWNRVKTTIKKWKPGDYVRQISVVVIGILITFAGSNLITNCSEKRDIQSTMLLIKEELKRNKQQFEYIVSEFSKDERLSTLLVENNMNCRAISEDSLKQFNRIMGHIRSYSYTRNALDILKNSMLMQKISDKEFLLSLSEIYETLEGFKLSMNGYYDMKDAVVTPFHLSLTDEQTDQLCEGGYDTWDLYLSDKAVRNFLRIPQGYFTSGYRKRIEQKIDKMIEAIEEKYGSI